MASPNWTRYSLLDFSLPDFVIGLGEFLAPMKFRLAEVGRLLFDPDRRSQDFSGETAKCNSEAEALRIGGKWDGMALAYVIRDISARIYFHFWAVDGKVALCVETATSVPYFENDELGPGEWFERFLCSMLGFTRASVCGYGNSYVVRYEPLDPEVVIAEIWSGELFARSAPSFHGISLKLLDAAEGTRLFEAYPKHPLLRHSITTTGYHVFSTLRRS